MAAAAGFRIRRIKSDQSIGDKLKRTRVRKKISVAEVEEATKIRAKFILALEGDSWDQIPSEVYGRGYLETYLVFLKIPSDDVMKQYDRERALYAGNCQDAKVELSPKSELHLPRFFITPRSFLILFIILGVIGFGGVVGFQLKKFMSAPFLELVTPVEAGGSSSTELYVTTNKVTLTGRTAIGARVQVNNHEVAVNENGNFADEVAVQKGVNAIVVEAVSSNGKKTSEILTVTVK